MADLEGGMIPKTGVWEARSASENSGVRCRGRNRPLRGLSGGLLHPECSTLSTSGSTRFCHDVDHASRCITSGTSTRITKDLKWMSKQGYLTHIQNFHPTTPPLMLPPDCVKIGPVVEQADTIRRLGHSLGDERLL